VGWEKAVSNLTASKWAVLLNLLLDSKSTLFDVINNFRLYNRVCIVSALMARHELSVSEDSPQVRRLVVTGCPHVAHLDLIYARVAASWWLAVCPRRSPEILMCSPCSPRASLSSHHHRKQKTSDDGAQEYTIRPRPPPSRGRGCYVRTRERRRILFPDTIGLG